jgi:type IV secretory pathway VirB9-like protein
MKAIMLPLLFILAAYATALGSSPRVKKVEVQKDQIVHVNTAMGIATIIQVPDRPNSVVVGDQDAFKVEYLDLAITIKPITPHGKSNLYIYTDYRRFNVELATGSEASADYVVYLDNPKEKDTKSSFQKGGASVSWQSVAKSFKNENITFTVDRIGHLKSGVEIVEFKISSSKKKT